MFVIFEGFGSELLLNKLRRMSPSLSFPSIKNVQAASMFKCTSRNVCHSSIHERHFSCTPLVMTCQSTLPPRQTSALVPTPGLSPGQTAAPMLPQERLQDHDSLQHHSDSGHQEPSQAASKHKSSSHWSCLKVHARSHFRTFQRPPQDPALSSLAHNTHRQHPCASLCMF